MLDKRYAAPPHRERSRGKAVRFVDIGADHRQTEHICQLRVRLMRIVDMLPADRGPRGCDAQVGEREHFDDLSAVEWITNPHTPGAAIFESRNRDVPTRVDEIVAMSMGSQDRLS